MFSHIMIGANDLQESKAFYDATLGVLGYQPGVFHKEFERFAYTSQATGFVVGKPNDGNKAYGANGGTIGFSAPDSTTIDSWYAAGIANGGTPCEEPPGIRERSGRKFYAAYLRDPAGNKTCAIHWIA